MGAVVSIIDATEAATQDYVRNVWTAFDTVAQPIIVAIGTLALAVTGYLLLTGQLRLPDILPRLVRWAIVLTLLLNVPGLYNLAYAIVTDVPDAVAGFMLAETATAPTEDEVLGMIETVMNAGMESASAVWEDSGYLDLSSHMVSLLLLITALALAVVATVLLMLSKLAVGILLAVGPFFLLLRLVDVGKGLFEGWLRQLLTFALVPVFVYSLIALNFEILEEAHTQLEQATLLNQLTLTNIVPFILVAIANLLLLTQVMSWAGGVGGGIALAVSAGAVMHTAGQVVQYGQRLGQMAGPVGQRAAGMATSTADVLRRMRLGGRG